MLDSTWRMHGFSPLPPARIRTRATGPLPHPTSWQRVTGILSTRDLEPGNKRTCALRLPLWRDFWVRQWDCAGRLPAELTASRWVFVRHWLSIRLARLRVIRFRLRSRLYKAIHGHEIWED